MDRIEFCDEVHNMLDKVVDLNKLNRSSIQENVKTSMGNEAYIREYCTIRFDIGRQSGKSEWIRRRATEDDLVIICKTAYKGYFRGIRADVMSIHEISRNRHALTRGTDNKYKTVYIDEPMFTLKKISFDEIFPFLINWRIKEQTIILLGM